ncbi:DUF167 domain-containing protein [archaeon]|nr:DUF167 domain-containing protein [archaeon]MBT6824423.1 DUF167 domain-containing protein [archaeon]MBT7107298.1 DUF167 domain-containing protein [archaeon]MBT7297399.1 DUF167 domain-containing protein [archaeon]
MERTKIIVRTNANENSIKFDKDFDAYRVSVKSSPEKGKANSELEKFLTKHFKRKVKIISGFKAKRKIIEF